MPRKATKKSFTKKLDRIFSKYIRQHYSSYGTAMCVTCKKVLPIEKIHCGHFISRRYKSIRWDERNAHPQCAGCNTFRGGAPHEYFVFMEEKYGRDTVDELMKLKEQKGPHLEEMEEMYKYFSLKLIDD